LVAAELHRVMAERATELARGVEDIADVEVCFTGGSQRRMRRWLGPGVALCGQGDGDLGLRMRRAMARSFDRGHQRVVIMGTDCPSIERDDLRSAFAGLGESDVVIGPSVDGGYWLIGLRGMRHVFEGIEWGGSDVLDRTIRRAEASGLSVRQLRLRHDVDEPEDLAAAGLADVAARPVISVVVPTLNERSMLASALHSATNDGVEIIVADGGSTDGTAGVAEAVGAKVLTTRASRPEQMNVGAKASAGRILIFLHADTQLPWGFAGAAFDGLLDRTAVGGAYRFATDSNLPGMHLITRLVQFRSHRLGLPYGDQALFCRRDEFEALGGYRPLAIAEDMDLVRRLRLKGRLVILPNETVTSARRWERVGALRTTVINQVVVLGALAGISSDRLRAFYDGSAR
jgi:rSAM/selenodomain-associated transferase 2/rSAM/selenodomain-associated transferase 1